MSEDIAKFDCTHCGRKSMLKVLARVERVTPSPDAGDRTHEVHKFGQCMSCLNVALLMSLDGYSFYIKTGESEPAGGLIEHRVYPPEGRFERGLPDSVKAGLAESHRCMKARAYRAAVLMCRATLEAVCEDLGYRRNTLAASLNALSEAGEVDGRMYEWAEALRSHGNLAAHEHQAEFTWRDANDIVEFTEALLINIFQIGAQFEQYMKRQERSSE